MSKVFKSISSESVEEIMSAFSAVAAKGGTDNISLNGHITGLVSNPDRRTNFSLSWEEEETL